MNGATRNALRICFLQYHDILESGHNPQSRLRTRVRHNTGMGMRTARKKGYGQSKVAGQIRVTVERLLVADQRPSLVGPSATVSSVQTGSRATILKTLQFLPNATDSAWSVVVFEDAT